MALREVIVVGDLRLRQKSQTVRHITPEIEQLITDMIETMHASDGIGLAAAQVGVLQRVIVIEVPEDEDIPGSGRLYVVLNPEILKTSKETEVGVEGCLSIPGRVGEVERAFEIVVRGLDARGKKFNLRPRGFLARVFQHEIDHTEGVLYIDRLTAPERIWAVKEGEEEQAELEQRNPERRAELATA